MDTTTIYYAIAALLALVGLAGIVLPALPGVPLIYAGMLLAAWAEDSPASEWPRSGCLAC